MVRKIIKNIHWIIILLLLIVSVILYEIASNRSKELQERIKFDKSKAIADSIKVRQLLRAEEEKAFRYRDSLRQMKINYILLQNEKSRKQINAKIERVRGNSSTQYRDSIWTTEWSTKDSLPY